MTQSPSIRLASAIALCAAVGLSGCAGEKTRYGDARSVETVTNQFGSTDLQMIAESMTRSMLNTPIVTEGNRPVMTVQEVKNKTREYIDTRTITDTIRVELQKSGRVRFAVDAAAMEQQVEELKRQQSDYYDADKAAEVGKMVGAGSRIEGNIASIVKEAKGVKDVYYKFSLQLWNVRS